MVNERDVAPAHPDDSYLAELDRLIAAHDPSKQDRVMPAIAAGTAPQEVVRRVALEAYHAARWLAPEVALLVANAPDAYAFTIEQTRHYRHWAERFSAVTGFADGPGELGRRLERCRGLGLTDDDVRGYAPIPETIAAVFTTLYYVRRSYEEGVAALGYAGARIGAAGADADAARRQAAELLRLAALTRPAQDRCREAIRNVLLVAEARVRAMNRWLDG